MNYLIMKEIHNSEQMGSQMMNYISLYLLGQKTGHSFAFHENSLHGRTPTTLITDTFNYPFVYLNTFDETVYLTKYPYPEMYSLNKDKTYYIHGLFHNAISILSKELKSVFNFYDFKQKIVEEAKKQIAFFKQKNKNITSVHFRRTDYAQIGAALSLDYYKEAIKYFNHDDVFLVFSDDITWCKTIKDEIFGNRCVVFSENNKQNIDMCMMSMCDNNLIANSTYSIWGAVLNKNKSAKIVSPKTAPGGCDLKLCFKNWICTDYTLER